MYKIKSQAKNDSIELEEAPGSEVVFPPRPSWGRGLGLRKNFVTLGLRAVQRPDGIAGVMAGPT